MYTFIVINYYDIHCNILLYYFIVFIHSIWYNVIIYPYTICAIWSTVWCTNIYFIHIVQNLILIIDYGDLHVHFVAHYFWYLYYIWNLFEFIFNIIFSILRQLNIWRFRLKVVQRLFWYFLYIYIIYCIYYGYTYPECQFIAHSCFAYPANFIFYSPL